jgi:hypothetical protein
LILQVITSLLLKKSWREAGELLSSLEEVRLDNSVIGSNASILWRLARVIIGELIEARRRLAANNISHAATAQYAIDVVLAPDLDVLHDRISVTMTPPDQQLGIQVDDAAGEQPHPAEGAQARYTAGEDSVFLDIGHEEEEGIRRRSHVN